MMGSRPTQTTSLKLDPEIRARVQRLAEARRRTSHWVMREAIAEYLGREEERERLRTDAEAAWAEYQATGLHATSAEVDSWLARLEAGDIAAPPTCHR
ncbi:MAG: ribbon-helix-helix protein, CopG family [Acetobacteraceae bacterium]